MAENSKIEWTDHTFNPWRGCTKVSPGCANCYAETLSKRNPAVLGEWGKGKPRVLASEAMWKAPVKWNREAELAWENWSTAVDARQGDSGPMPRRPRVFCASLADWLDDEVPIEWLARLLDLIRITPNLYWLLLTKRPQNFHARLKAVVDSIPRTGITLAEADLRVRIENMLNGWDSVIHSAPGVGIENYWIGTSVEDQPRYDERKRDLLKIPAKVRFLSCEPLLGPVDFGDMHGIHWVIAGGESGSHPRPMHPEWVRGLRDQCQSAGVPFFFKQWGEWKPTQPVYDEEDEYDSEEWMGAETIALSPKGAIEPVQADGGFAFQPQDHSWVMQRIGKKKAGHLLDGQIHQEFPLSH